MSSREPEISDELAELINVGNAIEEDTNRLRSLHRKGKLYEVLADELVSTILPLLRDLAKATVASAAATEDWGIGVEEALDGVGGPAGPALDKEVAELFAFLFERLRDLIAGA